MATLKNTTVNGTLATSPITVSGGIGAGQNVNNSGLVNVAPSNSTAVVRVNNFQSYLSRESPNRGPLPLSFLSNTSGTNLHPDVFFASGSNGIVIYNNSGGTGVQHFRETGTNVPNTSGVWIRIVTNSTGSISPNLGGWFFADFAKVNALHICYFTALCPVGYTIGFHSNSMGTGVLHYWATSNAGTGKWENYAYVVQAGNGGNSSTFFFALQGATRPVTWYLSMATSFRLG